MLPNTIQPTPAQLAAAEAFRQWEAQRWAAHRARTPGQRSGDGYGDYGMSCTKCGGTPSGDSVRGFVGTCTCARTS